jgi:hypothetical protein
MAPFFTSQELAGTWIQPFSVCPSNSEIVPEGGVGVGDGVDVGTGVGQVVHGAPQISTSVRLLKVLTVDPWPT